MNRRIGAALVVSAVAVGAGVGIARSFHSRPGPDTDPAHRYASLVLHDGQSVQTVTQVLAAPGKPVMLCSPNVQYAADGGGPPSCTGITASGVNLSELAGRTVTDGIVRGTASLTGVYRARHLTVTAQRAQALPKQFTLPDLPPCPTPDASLSDGPIATADTASNGLFQLELPPGRYYLSACTRASGPDCRSGAAVAVADAQTASLVLTCQIK